MKKRSFKYITIALTVLIVLIFFGLMSVISNAFAIKHQHSNSALKLSMAKQRIEENIQNAEKDWEIYDSFISEKVAAVSYLWDQKGNGINDLRKITKQWGLDIVFLTDSEGNVETSIGSRAKSLDEAGLSRLVQYVKKEDTHPYKTVNNICYYICEREDGKYLVGGIKSDKMIAAQDERYTPAYSLKDIKVGDGGFIIAFNSENNVIEYIPDERFIGHNIGEVIDINDWSLEPSGLVSYNQEKFYYECETVNVDNNSYTLLAMVPKSEITESTNAIVVCVLVMLIITAMFMIAYSVFRDMDTKSSAKSSNLYLTINKSAALDLYKGKKMLSILYIGIVMLVLGTAYLSSMALMSRQMVKIEDSLSSVDEILGRNDNREQEIINNYEDEYGRRAQNISWSIDYDSSLINDDVLSRMADITGIRDINIFDETGKKEATNSVYKDFALSTNEEDQSYEFWNVVKGYEKLLIQKPQLNETTKTFTQYIGAARIDKKGMVQLAVEPSLLEERLESSALKNVLAGIVLENNGFLFAVNKDTQIISAFKDPSVVGNSIAAIGLKDSALKERYVGWQKLNGISYFLISKAHGSDYVYAAVPSRQIFADVIPVALISGIMGTITLIVILLSLMLVSTDNIKNVNQPKKESEKRIFEIVEADNIRHRSEAAASRWDGRFIKFAELEAPEKMTRLIQITLGIAALLVLAADASGLADNNPFVAFVLSGTWEHAVNIFSVSYIVYIIIIVISVSSVLRFIISKITKLGNSRVETVGRLVNSFIKYVSVIGAVFYALTFVGVDSMTMLAGAGIMTLIIGLGAQSLVSDILAGLFIVFEGEFRVGDIVTIDNWRGTVEEIGIRTTKVKSPGQDIKIFRNSSISGVINQTRQYSFATIDVGIEYGESLERVEAVLKNELPRIKEHIHAIVDGPFYKGVSELGDNSVNIRIVAQCREKDRIQVLRDLNREIKLTFDRNNIGIPFPQIVLNQAATFEKANAAQKREANEFVKKQKEMIQENNINE